LPVAKKCDLWRTIRPWNAPARLPGSGARATGPDRTRDRHQHWVPGCHRYPRRARIHARFTAVAAGLRIQQVKGRRRICRAIA
jgi:hypothetical protein